MNRGEVCLVVCSAFTERDNVVNLVGLTLAANMAGVEVTLEDSVSPCRLLTAWDRDLVAPC